MLNVPDREISEENLQISIGKQADSAPRLASWIEENLTEGFTVFDYLLEHRRTIRATNSLERINKEICRCTRVVGVFPNEASCLRLVSALLMGTSEEWQMGKHYCAIHTDDHWVFLTQTYRKMVESSMFHLFIY